MAQSYNPQRVAQSGYDNSNSIQHPEGAVGGLETEAHLSDFDPVLVDAAKGLHAQGITSLSGAKKALKKAKFTLIELLVVVSVIGILAGMLLPVLSKAKEKAKRTECMSNQKQIMTAVQMYADDNRGFMPRGPPVNADAEPNLYDTANGPRNLGNLTKSDYLQLGNVYFCPSANFYVPSNENFGVINWGSGNVIGSSLWRNMSANANEQRLGRYSSGDALMVDHNQQANLERHNHKAEYSNIAAGDGHVEGENDKEGWSYSGGDKDLIFQEADKRLRE